MLYPSELLGVHDTAAAARTQCETHAAAALAAGPSEPQAPRGVKPASVLGRISDLNA